MSIFRRGLQIFVQHGYNQQVPAASLRFLSVHSNGILTGTTNAKTPAPLILLACFLNTNTVQPATGSLVFDLWVNNVFFNTLFTVPAGGAIAEYSNDGIGAALNAGDVWRINVTNNAPATASAQITAWSFLAQI